jgi:high-affinity nickel permease
MIAIRQNMFLRLNLSGPIWDQVGHLNENFGIVGVVIVLLFIASWSISTIIYKVKRYDEIEVTMAPRPDQAASGVGK